MATRTKKRMKSYAHIKFDENGWVCNGDFKPLPYDIAFVEVERENYKRIIPAWWTGSSWMGRKLKDKDIVLKWSRNRVVI